MTQWCVLFCSYRMLSRPYAFGCIMRLRTSSEFKPGHSVSVACYFIIAIYNYTFSLLYFLCYFAVWTFLPRSTIWECSAHYLLWFLCHICIWLWVCKHQWFLEVENALHHYHGFFLFFIVIFFINSLWYFDYIRLIYDHTIICFQHILYTISDSFLLEFGSPMNPSITIPIILSIALDDYVVSHSSCSIFSNLAKDHIMV